MTLTTPAGSQTTYMAMVATKFKGPVTAADDPALTYAIRIVADASSLNTILAWTKSLGDKCVDDVIANDHEVPWGDFTLDEPEVKIERVDWSHDTFVNSAVEDTLPCSRAALKEELEAVRKVNKTSSTEPDAEATGTPTSGSNKAPRSSSSSSIVNAAPSTLTSKPAMTKQGQSSDLGVHPSGGNPLVLKNEARPIAPRRPL